MAQKEIKTSIVINATPETVWNILLDFEKYDSWNPFLTSVEGIPQVGNKLKINADGMKFRPKVLVFNQQKELRWLGKLGFKGLFDGEHSFQIIDNHDGTVTFNHNEKFSGLLVKMFSKKLDSNTKLGFEKMNRALKERAENKNET